MGVMDSYLYCDKAEEYMMDTNGKLQEIWKFSELFLDIFYFLTSTGFTSVIMQFTTLLPFSTYWKISAL